MISQWFPKELERDFINYFQRCFWAELQELVGVGGNRWIQESIPKKNVSWILVLKRCLLWSCARLLISVWSWFKLPVCCFLSARILPISGAWSHVLQSQNFAVWGSIDFPFSLKEKLQDTKHQYCDIADAGQLMLNALHVLIFSCGFPFAQMPFAISEFFFPSQPHSLFSSSYCISSFKKIIKGFSVVGIITVCLL